MISIPFRKMHGAANDFVVVDHRRPFLPVEIEPLVRRLCDRRRGIGADGLLLLEADNDHDFGMRYYNADGGPADYCGNGARCLARLAMDLGLGDPQTGVRFRTRAGVQRGWPDPLGRGIVIDFGGELSGGEACTVEACGRSFAGQLIRIGVPHFVTEVERVEWVPITEWGPALRQHPRFGTAGANVDFIARLGSSRVALRTYERGVESETLACGSGAIAAGLWAAEQGERSPVGVLTAGGDELIVAFERAGKRYRVSITGPAEVAFEGVWHEPAPAPA